MRVWSELPAVRLWLAAPASDHDVKWNWVPDRLCGVGAATELRDPAITVRVNGAVADWPLSARANPVGFGRG